MIRRAILANSKFIIALCLICSGIVSRAQADFPAADALLQDIKHKEPKSGVSMQGDQIVIQTGVGTPSTINAVTFSVDGTLLVAGKDFGRVVIFDVKTRAVFKALETGQGIIKSVAISPDKTMIATAGDKDDGKVIVWKISDSKAVRSFAVVNPVVQRLIFLTNEHLLIKENQPTICVIDLTNGKHLVDINGEGFLTISNDGTLMITAKMNTFVLRSTVDWHVIQTFARLTKSSAPVALSSKKDLFVFEDSFDPFSFSAASLTDGHLLQNPRLVKLPKSNLSAGYFASIDETTGIVFGHSDARLWAWNPSTGQVCASNIQYSETGALSSDGTFVAAPIDNSFFAAKKQPTGVGIWSTSNILKSCGIEPVRP